MSRAESQLATRQRILEAASVVFARKGFFGASVEEITEQAGLSRGAFYSNFADKDVLFLALLEDRFEARVEEIRQLLGSARDPASFFAALKALNAGRKKDLQHWFMLRMEFVLYALRHPRARAKLAAFQRGLIEMLAEAVTFLHEELGVAPPMAPTQIAAVVQALDDGLAIQRYVDADALPGDFSEDVLDVLLRASAALARASDQ
jgi:AcrR family transcriptional regulator